MATVSVTGMLFGAFTYVNTVAMFTYVDIKDMFTYVNSMDVINTRTVTRLGTTVKQLRARRGLSQVEVAAQAGVSRTWLSQLESGSRDNVELASVARVLDVLGAHLAVQSE